MIKLLSDVKFKAMSMLLVLVITICVNQTIEASELVLEEILVTAQKRTESLQDVPIAISAFTAGDLSSAGIKTTDDLSLITPGLEMTHQLLSATSFIRGVGSNASGSGSESSVATYVDGVYLASPVMAVTAFNNIERIEVLKGPQGTLFGRNSTGGIIHIITKLPTYDNQLKVSATFEDYDTTETSIYGSTGLSETIAADISISVRRQGEGYGENLFDGSDAAYSEYSLIRSKILWEPSADSTITFSASWAEKEGDLGSAWACLKGHAATCITGAPVTENYHDILMDFGPDSDAEQKDFSLKIEHSFDNVDFMSLTAYHDSDSTDFADQDAGPFPIINVIQWGVAKTFSQELQVQSNDSSAPFQWIVGAYYFDNEAGRQPTELSGLGLAGAGLDKFISYSLVSTESIAAFAQGTYQLTDSTSVTAGIRYTRDKREISGRNELEVTGVGTVPIEFPSRSKTFTEPTWRLSIDHHFTDSIMGYVSYNRGFKSGNFDPVLLFKTSIGEPVDPEILDAYEIGMKGDFFDSRLRLSASAFFYDFSDLQLSRVEAGGSTLFNAAEAENTGFEVEGEALITEHLSLNFGLSVLDTEYTSFPNCKTPLGPIDCSGNDLMRSPDYTYNIGIKYEVPSSIGMFTFDGTVAYNDGFYWEPNNILAEESYTIVNGSLTWSSNDEKYSLSIYGRNLLDEEYSIWTQESDFGNVYAAAPPKLIGMSLSVSFF